MTRIGYFLLNFRADFYFDKSRENPQFLRLILQIITFTNVLLSPEAILKKSIVVLPIILASCLSQSIFAKDDGVSIKKSCLKDYPLAVGDTDSEIIGFYNQLCDKKNKKDETLKNQLLTNIATKYQNNGYNLKALQVVDELRGRKFQSPELTDVTFLAGVAISYNALNNMRSNENRTLDETTYAPAKVFADNIRYIQPVSEKTNSAVKDTETDKPAAYKPRQTTQKPKKQANSKPKQTQAKAKKPVETTKKPVATTKKQASGSSPFDTLKNK